jgi:glycine cleavage system H protein
MAALKYPADLKYTKSDEWVRVEGETVTIGISDYAQDALNDLTYLEFSADIGSTLDAGDAVAEVESVKASSSIYTPVGGEVVAVNSAIKESAETINADPYGQGWLVKLKVSDTSALDALMNAADYKTYCESR